MSLQTISWVSSLVWLGFRRPITKDNLYTLDDNDKSENVYKKFTKLWMIKKKASNRSVGYKVQPTSKTDTNHGIQLDNLRLQKPEKISDSNLSTEMQRTKSSLVMTVLRMDKSSWITAAFCRGLECCIQVSYPIVLR